MLWPREFFLIAGPCVLETRELHDEIADTLLEIRRNLAIPILFKASFDKANRSRPDAARGPGLTQGLELLSEVRERSGLPILTDIHDVNQIERVAVTCDALQIPALLCRQTDLLRAAAHTGRPINVKKGQSCAATDMRGAVEKIRQAGNLPNYPVAVTERGTFFGYGDLVVDFRNIPRLREQCHAPVVFDGTHSLQRPGLGKAGASGGLSQYIEPMVRAAVAAGADGLFLEVHPNPNHAPSDAASMLPLGRLQPLMRDVAMLLQARGAR